MSLHLPFLRLKVDEALEDPKSLSFFFSWIGTPVLLTSLLVDTLNFGFLKLRADLFSESAFSAFIDSLISFSVTGRRT